MDKNWYNISNLNTYVNPEYLLHGIKLPRKKKKELKKVYVYYDKDLDLVVITKGNKRKELSFKKFFTDMEKAREYDLSVSGLEGFIFKQVSML